MNPNIDAPADKSAPSGFRKAVPPEPKRYAQCRNCKHFVYDDSDYCGSKGQLAFRKINLRCRQLQIKVQMGTVCDEHQFANHDRSDR
ncbi:MULTISPECIES: hypothetical protein [unclassified Variovorax]|uniref:hypothetical protein n=1 Tax=unclassified Variovorax TaxID=663243 RepID=UPI003F45F435